MAEPLFDFQHPLENYLSESLLDTFHAEMPGRLEEMLESVNGVGIDVQELDWQDGHIKKATRCIVNASAIAISFLSSLYITPPGDRRPSKPEHAMLAQQFSEKFKYVMISSSLLDASITPTTTLPDFSMFTSSTMSGSPPEGSPSSMHHHQYSSGDRMMEISLDSDQDEPTAPLPGQPPPSPISQLLTHQSATAFAAAIALYVNGYTLLFAISLLVVAFKFFASPSGIAGATTETADARRAYERERLQVARSSYVMTLEALETLVLAGNVWNSVVNEAVSTLELEEKRIFYGPTSALSPGFSTTSLRVALHSTLQTSQSQSDNVRQLFTPLTSSRQLAQLSEMYAPSTPVKMKAFASFQQQMNSKLGHGRPMSLSLTTPASRFQVSAIDDSHSQVSKADKRSTWSAGTKQIPVGLGTSFLARREKKLRSGLSLAINTEEDRDAAEGDESSFADTSLGESEERQPGVPVDNQSLTPETPAPKVTRNYHNQQWTTASASTSTSKSRRSPLPARQRDQPLSVSSSTSSNSLSGHFSSEHQSLRTSPSSSTMAPSPSRLTLVQTTRHPLSLSALHSAIQTAVGSKRYAAAHLLALRFGDDDDRDDEDDYCFRSKRSSLSVQGTDLRRRSLKGAGHSRKASYTSNITDISIDRVDDLDWEFDLDYWEDVRSVMSLLTSALEDAAQRLVDAMEESDRERTKEIPPSPLPPIPAITQSCQSLAAPVATLPSPLRLSHLRQRGGRGSLTFAPTPSTLTKFATHIHAISAALDEAREHLADCASYVSREGSSEPTNSSPASFTMAIQSYESLRKELGFALRECERTRAPLMEAFQNQSHAEAEAEDEDEDEDLPALGHDQSSNEDLDSDPQDREMAMPPVHEKMYIGPSEAQEVEDVDATAQHLLLTSNPAHLPLSGGLEQVFESVGGGSFNRPKTQMTREERIAVVKAKRASLGPGTKISLVPGGEVIERSASLPGNDNAWGPGGEVVQELKDVILRVGERRKRLASEQNITSPRADTRPRSMMELSTLLTTSNLLPLSAPPVDPKSPVQQPTTSFQQADSPTIPEFSELEIPMGIAM